MCVQHLKWTIVCIFGSFNFALINSNNSLWLVTDRFCCFILLIMFWSPESGVVISQYEACELALLTYFWLLSSMLISEFPMQLRIQFYRRYFKNQQFPNLEFIYKAIGTYLGFYFCTRFVFRRQIRLDLLFV